MVLLHLDAHGVISYKNMEMPEDVGTRTQECAERGSKTFLEVLKKGENDCRKLKRGVQEANERGVMQPHQPSKKILRQMCHYISVLPERASMTMMTCR